MYLKQRPQIDRRLRASTESASRFEQPVDALHHVLMVGQFTAFGCRNPLLNPGNKAGLTFQHSGNRIFHQLLPILAIGKRNLLKPRFDVGREMNFHTSNIRKNWRGGKIWRWDNIT